MRTFFSTALILSMLLLLGSSLSLVGCGKSEYVSTDEFLEGISLEKKPGEIDIGTLPPVDEPMEEVAKIRVETNEFDMGVIAHDKLAHARIKVYNDGLMPLKITKIDTTCACTQGSVTPENALIQGGESSWIDIVVDPRRIPGFHTRKVLSIISTDPKNMVVKVGVTSEVDPEYEIGPDKIDLGDIPKGKPFEKRLRFRQLIEQTVNVVEWKSLFPGALKSLDSSVTTSVEEVPEGEWRTPGRHEFDLVITFGADMPTGPFTRYAVLTTDIKRANQQRLTFTGTVIAPYAVKPAYPDYAQLKPVKGENGYHAQFVFSAATLITIKGISSSTDGVVAVASQGTSPNEAFIDVSYTGSLPKTDVFDEVLDVELEVNGKTYTEKIGFFLKPE